MINRPAGFKPELTIANLRLTVTHGDTYLITSDQARLRRDRTPIALWREGTGGSFASNPVGKEGPLKFPSAEKACSDPP
jgi:hypothetical protein